MIVHVCTTLQFFSLVINIRLNNIMIKLHSKGYYTSGNICVTNHMQLWQKDSQGVLYISLITDNVILFYVYTYIY